ncbi:MAG TPA: aconitase/3-isopropylmalate dehydratase large subunit family protein [Actinomycetota bacterium]|nr:aconitase/3-isopropylmalate dehydratase large subunit family protein [Actinomycetota bacterium]
MSATTLAQRILERKVGHAVAPGDVVDVDVDVALTHDVLGPLTFARFEELGVPLWDPDKVYITIDHFVPAATREQAENNAAITEAVRRHGVRATAFYDGPSHQTLAESGMVRPGHVVVGTDSHTCTAGALGAFATGIGSTEMVGVFVRGHLWFRVPEGIAVLFHGALAPGTSAKDAVLELLARIGVDGATYCSLEFGGPGLERLPMDERLVLANMSVELGAKTGIVEVDGATLDYLGLAPDDDPALRMDADAPYARRIDIDLSELVPLVAAPHSPENVRPVTELAGRVPVHQAFIGSCTGGRLTDYRAAAAILDGRKVAPGVRLIVTPASKKIYRALLHEGIVDVFADAGAIVEPASCGPCAGLQAGILADGENAIAASNRNFRGRMGNPNANVYLASPATVAASAVAGAVADPRELLTEARAPAVTGSAP